MQERVTGIGGIFFKAPDTDKLRDCYQKHLGIQCEPWGGSVSSGRALTVPGNPGKPSDHLPEEHGVLQAKPRGLDAELPRGESG